jgi:hypothetical protein
MRRQPLDRPELILALAVAEIERIKALLARVTDSRGLVVATGTGSGDTTPPVETGAHTLYGVKHTRAFRVTDGGGLDIDYEQGQIWTGGSFYSIVAGLLTMDDNDTNYVFINSGGAVAYNVTGFPADGVPLAQVTTVAGDITAIADRRSYLLPGASVIGSSHDASLIIDDDSDTSFETEQVADEDIIRLTAATVEVAVIGVAGQWQLPVVGAGAGVLIGGDTQLYRSAPGILMLAAGDTLAINDADFTLDAAGEPTITFDANDYLLYVRASDYYSFNIGSTEYVRIGTGGTLVDVIDELTGAAGVTIEGVQMLDSDVLIATNNFLQFRDAALQILSSADGQLDIDADVVVEITAPTIELIGDVIFEGDGTGLPYGCMHGYNIAETVAVGVVDTWYELTAGLVSVETNLVTFQNNHELKVTKAGRYAINWSMAVQSTTANDEFEGAIAINNTADTTTACHATLVKANAAVCLSGGSVVDLAANDLISVAVLNHSTNRDIMVEHVTLTVVMVGGT